MRTFAAVLAGTPCVVSPGCGWIEESREAAKHEGPGLEAVQAAERGDVEALKAVLARDPAAANGKRWTTGKRKGSMRALTDTALTAALRVKGTAAVELLLAAGADPNLPLDSDESPLDVLARVEPRDATTVALAKALVARGARLAPRTWPRTGETTSPLLGYGCPGRPNVDEEELLRFFASEPSALPATDVHGLTALHGAARGCGERPDVILLEAGADPNARSVEAKEAWSGQRTGNTPLHEAVHCTELDSVFALCAGGANPHLKNEAEETPHDAFRRMLTPERQQADTEVMRRGRASMEAALSPGGPCEEWYGRFLRSGRPSSWEAVHASRFELGCRFGESFDCGQSGWAYHRGEGVGVDLAKAMAAYRKACDLKSSWACGMVGSLHDNGEGVAADPAEAARWFATGCDGDDGQSCYRLGLLTRDGQGVAQDRARALALFEKACAKKYEKGCEGARALR